MLLFWEEPDPAESDDSSDILVAFWTGVELSMSKTNETVKTMCGQQILGQPWPNGKGHNKYEPSTSDIKTWQSQEAARHSQNSFNGPHKWHSVQATMTANPPPQ